MKFTTLLSACFLVSIGSFAQQSQLSPLQKIQQAIQGNHYVPVAHKNAQAKTTATSSRIKSYLIKTHDGGVFNPDDSLIINSYTGEHGGALTYAALLGNPGVIKYDSYNGLNYNMGTSSWDNSYKSIQTFDPNDNIATTISQNWNSGTSSWDNSSKDVFSYDANHNQLSDIYQNWNSGTTSWDNNSKDAYTYDANNNMLTEVYQNWNSGTTSWDNISKYTYTYDANNNLTQVVFQTWSGSMWVNSDKTTNTYTGNDITQSVDQSWNGTSWDNSSRITYVYAGGNNTEAVDQNWNSGTSSWDNDAKTLYTYDGSNRVITLVFQDWNTVGSVFENKTKDDLAYDSYDNLTMIESAHWNAGSFWENILGDTHYDIHNELYTVTGIAEINRGGSSSIYPSPAKDQITIGVNWDVPQSFGISVYDMQVRSMMQWNEAPSKEYSKTINVSELAAGNYFIRITGEKGLIVQPVSVIH